MTEVVKAKSLERGRRRELRPTAGQVDERLAGRALAGMRDGHPSNAGKEFEHGHGRARAGGRLWGPVWKSCRCSTPRWWSNEIVRCGAEHFAAACLVKKQELDGGDGEGKQRDPVRWVPEGSAFGPLGAPNGDG